MPAANFSRIDLDLLEPKFLATLLDVIAACEARGARYIATSGYRSHAEQMELWTQGRLKPGKIVTKAKAGQSSHNFGIACDFVRDTDIVKPGVQPGWNAKEYAVLAEEAVKAGLHSGQGYKDHPHVSLEGYVTATQLVPLDLAWRQVKGDIKTRLQYVWSKL